MAGKGGDADAEETQPLSEQLLDFSNIGRTVDGSGFTYRTAACIDKRLGVIKGIEAYTHLQHIDFSQNSIKDVGPLKGLQFLVSLNLAQNVIPTLKPWDPDEGVELYPNLTHLDLSSNILTELRPLPLKSLRRLNLKGNEIATCQEFTGHEALESMDLSGNKLTTLAGMANMPALTKLDLSSNTIEDINGLGELPALEEFSLAQNALQALEGPWQELASAPLKSLDLSGNQLEAPQPLEVLKPLLKLRNLCVAGNPFATTMGAEETMVEVLVFHRKLKILDGVDVEPEMKDRAKQLNKARLAEAREREKAEEEAAA